MSFFSLCVHEKCCSYHKYDDKEYSFPPNMVLSRALEITTKLTINRSDNCALARDESLIRMWDILLMNGRRNRINCYLTIIIIQSIKILATLRVSLLTVSRLQKRLCTTCYFNFQTLSSVQKNYIFLWLIKYDLLWANTETGGEWRL
jgi:hypothetical protein